MKERPKVHHAVAATCWMIAAAVVVIIMLLRLSHRHTAAAAAAWIPSRHNCNTITSTMMSTRSTPNNVVADGEPTPITRRKIAIVGGGLAGLSVAWHLLEHQQIQQQLSITILDRAASAGIGGASAVAGGYVLTFIMIY